jgi:DNA-binding GntR family transcriptional regulator
MERNVEIPRAASAIKRLTKEEIYERLRREIVDGELRPGQRLGEEWVAGRLGASRTPVREALHKLEADGLVVLRPHRGALVRPFDMDELIGIFDLRVRIEGYAAGRAATRLSSEDIEELARIQRRQMKVLKSNPRDQAEAGSETIRELVELNQEFHRLIHVGSGNRHVEVMLSRLAYLPLVYQAVYAHGAEGREVSLYQHEQLLHSFRTRDPELAEATMRAHIFHGREAALARFAASDLRGVEPGFD